MIDNYNDFKKYLNNLDYKPKLLLHACCAPCSTHCLKILSNYFDITIFYSNDNISPEEEFYKRLDEIKRFINEYNKDIKLIDNGYDESSFNEAIKGLENKGERSERCYNCYKLRLLKTAEFAKNNGFEYFSTTLSISPYKNSKWINEIGYEIEEKYDIKYLYSDFKKEDGYNDSKKMSKEYNLYRQDYCGCIYSKKERSESIDRIKKENNC